MRIQSLVIVLLLIMCVSLGFYTFNLRKKLIKSEDKNFRYEWAESQESFATYLKETTKLLSLSIDKNFDENFEIVNSYYTYGKLLGTFFDKNENGIYEKHFTFNPSGKKVSSGYDTDEDGAIDKFLLFYPNGNQLIFIDKNFDGYFEKINLKRENEISELNLEDIFK